MASLTNDSFRKSLEKFQKRLSAEQRQQFLLSNLDDVRLAVQQLQDRLGPEKKLRSFNRIKKFLEGMKQVEQLVQIFLNVHEVVAFVWGPIKLALMVASTKVETLERLLDVYQEIGEVLHGVGKYDRLFKNYPDFRRILEMYFYDVLEFHHEVLKVFEKSDWKRFLSYAWPTFKSNFEPIIDSLKRHRDLLSDEKLTVVLEEVEESHDIIETMANTIRDINVKLDKLKQATDDNKRKRDEIIRKQKEVIRMKLRPPNYNEDHRVALKRRVASSSGDWILEDQKFKAWLQGATSTDNLLYLNGIPGSGKTTIISRIVDYLLAWGSANNGTILFFYFKHASEAGRTKNGMLRALLSQLLDQDDTIREYLYQKCGSLADSEAVYEPFLEELVKYCFSSRGNIWIILDALDECEGVDETGTHLVIKWLQDEVLLATPLGSHIRLLVSGQRDGRIDGLLSQYPGIDLDKSTRHGADIEDYTSLRASSIKTRFKLKSDEEAELIRQVKECSKGMFLYAKIVLDNLFHQESIAKFRKELRQENFPKELNQAYERVVIRILDQPHEERRQSAISILGWVVSSGRPLRWREIQAKFCIEPAAAHCNFENRRIDSCKVICGSLVEVEPCEDYKNSESEQIVNIVHPTASSYLIQTGRIRIFEEHANAVIFCSQYLTSTPFTDDPDPNIRELALAGYYALQDYACAFWQYHAQSAISQLSDLSQDRKTEVIQSLMQLGRILQSKLCSGNLESNDSSRTLTEYNVLSKINEWCAVSGEESTLSRKVISIRKAIESINVDTLDEDEFQVFQELHGVLRFKCPRIKCALFATGFTDVEQRNSHIREHELPFKCSTTGCYAEIIGFSSSSALDAHVKRLHPDDSSPTLLFPRRSELKAASIDKAVARGDIETVKALHSMGVSLNRLYLGWAAEDSLLLHAVKKGQLAICEYLVRHGVDPHLGTIRSSSPMNEAVLRGDFQIFHFFKHFGVFTPSPYELIALIASAISSGSTEILNKLLDYVAIEKVSAKFLQAVFIDVASVCGRRLRYANDSLLEKQRASLRKLTEIVFPQLDNIPFGETTSSLVEEQRQNNIHVIPQNHMGDFLFGDLLSDACQNRAYSLAQHLLDLISLISPDRRVSALSGALHHLADNSEETSDFLKECMAKLTLRLLKTEGVNVGDPSGKLRRLPLHLAAMKGNLTCLRILIEHTTDINEKDGLGMTALEFAARHNHKEAAKMLIESGRVDISTKTKAGNRILESRDGKIYFSEYIKLNTKRRADVLTPITELALIATPAPSDIQNLSKNETGAD